MTKLSKISEKATKNLWKTCSRNLVVLRQSVRSTNTNKLADFMQNLHEKENVITYKCSIQHPLENPT